MRSETLLVLSIPVSVVGMYYTYSSIALFISATLIAAAFLTSLRERDDNS